MDAATYSPSIPPPPPRPLPLHRELLRGRSGAILRTSLFDLFLIEPSQTGGCASAVVHLAIGELWGRGGVGVGWGGGGCKGQSLELGFSCPDWYEAMTAGPP